MQGVIIMAPTMDVTIKNIKLLSPSAYEKASLYIEKLLKEEDSTISNEEFSGMVDDLFNEYHEAFSVLAQ